MPRTWWSAFARPISTAEPSYRLAKMDRPSSEALGDEARRSGWWQRALAARRAFRRPRPAEADRGDERAPRGPRQGRPRRRRGSRQWAAGRQHPAAERGVAPHRPTDATRRVRRGEPGADRLPPRPSAAQRVRLPRDPARRRLRDHTGPRRRQGSRVRQPDEADWAVLHPGGRNRREEGEGLEDGVRSTGRLAPGGPIAAAPGGHRGGGDPAAPG